MRDLSLLKRMGIDRKTEPQDGKTRVKRHEKYYKEWDCMPGVSVWRPVALIGKTYLVMLERAPQPLLQLNFS